MPIDFSPRSRLAVKYAAALAQKTGATLELLFVVEPVPCYAGLEGLPLAVGDGHLAQTARKRLQRQADRLMASGVTTRVSVRRGKAYAEICAHAEERGADLIILSTHGYSGLKRALMGSTAEEVLRRAPCAVLALRLDAGAGGVRREPHADVPHLRRILAAVDFSAPSRRALNYAVALARKFSAHLTVFHTSLSVPPPRRLAPFARELELGALKQARHDLTALLKETVPASLSVSTQVVAGIPREEILQAAIRSKSDLIIMATHGRRGLERWFMGSTAEHTLRYAPCPVLVVRRGDRDRPTRKSAAFSVRDARRGSPRLGAAALQEKEPARCVRPRRSGAG